MNILNHPVNSTNSTTIDAAKHHNYSSSPQILPITVPLIVFPTTIRGTDFFSTSSIPTIAGQSVIQNLPLSVNWQYNAHDSHACVFSVPREICNQYKNESQSQHFGKTPFFPHNTLYFNGNYSQNQAIGYIPAIHSEIIHNTSQIIENLSKITFPPSLPTPSHSNSDSIHTHTQPIINDHIPIKSLTPPIEMKAFMGISNTLAFRLSFLTLLSQVTALHERILHSRTNQAPCRQIDFFTFPQLSMLFSTYLNLTACQHSLTGHHEPIAITLPTLDVSVPKNSDSSQSPLDPLPNLNINSPHFLSSFARHCEKSYLYANMLQSPSQHRPPIHCTQCYLATNHLNKSERHRYAKNNASKSKLIHKMDPGDDDEVLHNMLSLYYKKCKDMGSNYMVWLESLQSAALAHKCSPQPSNNTTTNYDIFQEPNGTSKQGCYNYPVQQAPTYFQHLPVIKPYNLQIPPFFLSFQTPQVLSVRERYHFHTSNNIHSEYYLINIIKNYYHNNLKAWNTHLNHNVCPKNSPNSTIYHPSYTQCICTWNTDINTQPISQNTSKDEQNHQDRLTLKKLASLLKTTKIPYNNHIVPSNSLQTAGNPAFPAFHYPFNPLMATMMININLEIMLFLLLQLYLSCTPFISLAQATVLARGDENKLNDVGKLSKSILNRDHILAFINNIVLIQYIMKYLNTYVSNGSDNVDLLPKTNQSVNDFEEFHHPFLSIEAQFYFMFLWDLFHCITHAVIFLTQSSTTPTTDRNSNMITIDNISSEPNQPDYNIILTQYLFPNVRPTGDHMPDRENEQDQLASQTSQTRNRSQYLLQCSLQLLSNEIIITLFTEYVNYSREYQHVVCPLQFQDQNIKKTPLTNQFKESTLFQFPYWAYIFPNRAPGINYSDSNSLINNMDSINFTQLTTKLTLKLFSTFFALSFSLLDLIIHLNSTENDSNNINYSQNPNKLPSLLSVVYHYFKLMFPRDTSSSSSFSPTNWNEDKSHGNPPIFSITSFLAEFKVNFFQFLSLFFNINNTDRTRVSSKPQFKELLQHRLSSFLPAFGSPWSSHKLQRSISMFYTLYYTQINVINQYFGFLYDPPILPPIEPPRSHINENTLYPRILSQNITNLSQFPLQNPAPRLKINLLSLPHLAFLHHISLPLAYFMATSHQETFKGYSPTHMYVYNNTQFTSNNPVPSAVIDKTRHLHVNMNLSDDDIEYPTPPLCDKCILKLVRLLKRTNSTIINVFNNLNGFIVLLNALHQSSCENEIRDNPSIIDEYCLDLTDVSPTLLHASLHSFQDKKLIKNSFNTLVTSPLQPDLDDTHDIYTKTSQNSNSDLLHMNRETSYSSETVQPPFQVTPHYTPAFQEIFLSPLLTPFISHGVSAIPRLQMSTGALDNPTAYIYQVLFSLFPILSQNHPFFTMPPSSIKILVDILTLPPQIQSILGVFLENTFFAAGATLPWQESPFHTKKSIKPTPFLRFWHSDLNWIFEPTLLNSPYNVEDEGNNMTNRTKIGALNDYQVSGVYCSELKQFLRISSRGNHHHWEPMESSEFKELLSLAPEKMIKNNSKYTKNDFDGDIDGYRFRVDEFSNTTVDLSLSDHIYHKLNVVDREIDIPQDEANSSQSDSILFDHHDGDITKCQQSCQRLSATSTNPYNFAHNIPLCERCFGCELLHSHYYISALQQQQSNHTISTIRPRTAVCHYFIHFNSIPREPTIKPLSTIAIKKIEFDKERRAHDLAISGESNYADNLKSAKISREAATTQDILSGKQKTLFGFLKKSEKEAHLKTEGTFKCSNFANNFHNDVDRNNDTTIKSECSEFCTWQLHPKIVTSWFLALSLIRQYYQAPIEQIRTLREDYYSDLQSKKLSQLDICCESQSSTHEGQKTALEQEDFNVTFDESDQSDDVTHKINPNNTGEQDYHDQNGGNDEFDENEQDVENTQNNQIEGNFDEHDGNDTDNDSTDHASDDDERDLDDQLENKFDAVASQEKVNVLQYSIPVPCVSFYSRNLSREPQNIPKYVDSLNTCSISSLDVSSSLPINTATIGSLPLTAFSSWLPFPTRVIKPDDTPKPLPDLESPIGNTAHPPTNYTYQHGQCSSLWSGLIALYHLYTMFDTNHNGVGDSTNNEPYYSSSFFYFSPQFKKKQNLPYTSQLESYKSKIIQYSTRLKLNILYEKTFIHPSNLHYLHIGLNYQSFLALHGTYTALSSKQGNGQPQIPLPRTLMNPSDLTRNFIFATQAYKTNVSECNCLIMSLNSIIKTLLLYYPLRIAINHPILTENTENNAPIESTFLPHYLSLPINFPPEHYLSFVLSTIVLSSQSPQKMRENRIDLEHLFDPSQNLDKSNEISQKYKKFIKLTVNMAYINTWMNLVQLLLAFAKKTTPNHYLFGRVKTTISWVLGMITYLELYIEYYNNITLSQNQTEDNPNRILISEKPLQSTTPLVMPKYSSLMNRFYDTLIQSRRSNLVLQVNDDQEILHHENYFNSTSRSLTDLKASHSSGILAINNKGAQFTRCNCTCSHKSFHYCELLSQTDDVRTNYRAARAKLAKSAPAKSTHVITKSNKKKLVERSIPLTWKSQKSIFSSSGEDSSENDCNADFGTESNNYIESDPPLTKKRGRAAQSVKKVKDRPRRTQYPLKRIIDSDDEDETRQGFVDNVSSQTVFIDNPFTDDSDDVPQSTLESKLNHFDPSLEKQSKTCFDCLSCPFYNNIIKPQQFFTNGDSTDFSPLNPITKYLPIPLLLFLILSLSTSLSPSHDVLSNLYLIAHSTIQKMIINGELPCLALCQRAQSRQNDPYSFINALLPLSQSHFDDTSPDITKNVHFNSHQPILHYLLSNQAVYDYSYEMLVHSSFFEQIYRNNDANIIYSQRNLAQRVKEHIDIFKMSYFTPQHHSILYTYRIFTLSLYHPATTPTESHQFLLKNHEFQRNLSCWCAYPWYLAHFLYPLMISQCFVLTAKITAHKASQKHGLKANSNVDFQSKRMGKSVWLYDTSITAAQTNRMLEASYSFQSMSLTDSLRYYNMLPAPLIIHMVQPSFNQLYVEYSEQYNTRLRQNNAMKEMLQHSVVYKLLSQHITVFLNNLLQINRIVANRYLPLIESRFAGQSIVQYDHDVFLDSTHTTTTKLTYNKALYSQMKQKNLEKVKNLQSHPNYAKLSEKYQQYRKITILNNHETSGHILFQIKRHLISSPFSTTNNNDNFSQLRQNVDTVTKMSNNNVFGVDNVDGLHDQNFTSNTALWAHTSGAHAIPQAPTPQITASQQPVHSQTQFKPKPSLYNKPRTITSNASNSNSFDSLSQQQLDTSTSINTLLTFQHTFSLTDIDPLLLSTTDPVSIVTSYNKAIHSNGKGPTEFDTLRAHGEMQIMHVENIAAMEFKNAGINAVHRDSWIHYISSMFQHVLTFIDGLFSFDLDEHSIMAMLLSESDTNKSDMEFFGNEMIDDKDKTQHFLLRDVIMSIFTQLNSNPIHKFLLLYDLAPNMLFNIILYTFLMKFDLAPSSLQCSPTPSILNHTSATLNISSSVETGNSFAWKLPAILAKILFILRMNPHSLHFFSTALNSYYMPQSGLPDLTVFHGWFNFKHVYQTTNLSLLPKFTENLDNSNNSLFVANITQQINNVDNNSHVSVTSTATQAINSSQQSLIHKSVPIVSFQASNEIKRTISSDFKNEFTPITQEFSSQIPNSQFSILPDLLAHSSQFSQSQLVNQGLTKDLIPPRHQKNVIHNMINLSQFDTDSDLMQLSQLGQINADGADFGHPHNPRNMPAPLASFKDQVGKYSLAKQSFHLLSQKSSNQGEVVPASRRDYHSMFSQKDPLPTSSNNDFPETLADSQDRPIMPLFLQNEDNNHNSSDLLSTMLDSPKLNEKDDVVPTLLLQHMEFPQISKIGDILGNLIENETSSMLSSNALDDHDEFFETLPIVSDEINPFYNDYLPKLQSPSKSFIYSADDNNLIQFNLDTNSTLGDDNQFKQLQTDCHSLIIEQIAITTNPSSLNIIQLPVSKHQHTRYPYFFSLCEYFEQYKSLQRLPQSLSIFSFFFQKPFYNDRFTLIFHPVTSLYKAQTLPTCSEFINSFYSQQRFNVPSTTATRPISKPVQHVDKFLHRASLKSLSTTRQCNHFSQELLFSTQILSNNQKTTEIQEDTREQYLTASGVEFKPVLNARLFDEYDIFDTQTPPIKSDCESNHKKDETPIYQNDKISSQQPTPTSVKKYKMNVASLTAFSQFDMNNSPIIFHKSKKNPAKSKSTTKSANSLKSITSISLLDSDEDFALTVSTSLCPADAPTQRTTSKRSRVVKENSSFSFLSTHINSEKELQIALKTSLGDFDVKYPGNINSQNDTKSNNASTQFPFTTLQPKENNDESSDLEVVAHTIAPPAQVMKNGVGSKSNPRATKPKKARKPVKPTKYDSFIPNDANTDIFDSNEDEMLPTTSLKPTHVETPPNNKIFCDKLRDNDDEVLEFTKLSGPKTNLSLSSAAPLTKNLPKTGHHSQTDQKSQPQSHHPLPPPPLLPDCIKDNHNHNLYEKQGLTASGDFIHTPHRNTTRISTSAPPYTPLGSTSGYHTPRCPSLRTPIEQVLRNASPFLHRFNITPKSIDHASFSEAGASASKNSLFDNEDLDFPYLQSDGEMRMGTSRTSQTPPRTKNIETVTHDINELALAMMYRSMTNFEITQQTSQEKPGYLGDGSSITCLMLLNHRRPNSEPKRSRKLTRQQIEKLYAAHEICTNCRISACSQALSTGSFHDFIMTWVKHFKFSSRSRGAHGKKSIQDKNGVESHVQNRHSTNAYRNNNCNGIPFISISPYTDPLDKFSSAKLPLMFNQNTSSFPPLKVSTSATSSIDLTLHTVPSDIIEKKQDEGLTNKDFRQKALLPEYVHKTEHIVCSTMPQLMSNIFSDPLSLSLITNSYQQYHYALTDRIRESTNNIINTPRFILPQIKQPTMLLLLTHFIIQNVIMNTSWVSPIIENITPINVDYSIISPQSTKSSPKALATKASNQKGAFHRAVNHPSLLTTPLQQSLYIIYILQSYQYLVFKLNDDLYHQNTFHHSHHQLSFTVSSLTQQNSQHTISSLLHPEYCTQCYNYAIHEHIAFFTSKSLNHIGFQESLKPCAWSLYHDHLKEWIVHNHKSFSCTAENHTSPYFKLVEVKGKGDVLRPHQTLWLSTMSIFVQAMLLHVVPPSTSSRKS